MIQMNPFLGHNAWAGYQTPETTSENTPGAQKSETPLGGTCMWQRNEKQREQKDVGTRKLGKTGDFRVVRNGLMWVADDAT